MDRLLIRLPYKAKVIDFVDIIKVLNQMVLSSPKSKK